ncbi:MAG: MaoC family dehydratase N-terminal domain-containing protein [Polyangiaceae bacterium]|nr:MaoC family dehydratase N-terminal domain-containing protein [Polyangiaceae bacterium]
MSIADQIPSHVSTANRNKILELAEPGPLELSDVTCCEYLIRHWCETVEDGNPLYLDEEYAKSQGYDGIIAQAGMLICTLTLPYRWPYVEGRKSRRLMHFQLKELLELPVGILASYESFFKLPVQLGDRLTTTARLLSISDFKRTRLGEGYFTKIQTLYTNQREETVCETITNLFSYGGANQLGKEVSEEEKKTLAAKRAQPSTEADQAPADPPSPEAIRGGWHNGTEECLESWRTGWNPKPPNKLFFDDVKVGDELPELLMPITVTRCSFMASGSRDFAPQHHNSWYAHNKSKSRDMFLGTHFNLGMMSRFMTDWGGPTSTVRRIMLKMRRTICAGEDMFITGRVVKKFEKDGECCVDLEVEIKTDRGPAYQAGGTLVLAKRS